MTAPTDELAVAIRRARQAEVEAATLRAEVNRLRLNAEKDVCTGCMEREEQRDRWAEHSRQNGIKAEHAKQAWYRERDRAEQAEAAIERVRAKHVPVVRGALVICDACSPKRGDGPARYFLAPHPCDTIRALDGEQTGEAS